MRKIIYGLLALVMLTANMGAKAATVTREFNGVIVTIESDKKVKVAKVERIVGVLARSLNQKIKAEANDVSGLASKRRAMAMFVATTAGATTTTTTTTKVPVTGTSGTTHVSKEAGEVHYKHGRQF